MPTGVARTRAASSHWFDVVLLSGLGVLFLVNAVVAMVDPAAFTGLVARSGIGRWLSAGVLALAGPVIAANDLALGLGLLVAIRAARVRALILAWAGAWLLVVAALKLASL